jgi:hypothetical protein
MPAPVVADALGYHDKTTTRLLNEAGSQWSDMPLEITEGHYHARQHPQLATVEYASPPGPCPGRFRAGGFRDRRGGGLDVGAGVTTPAPGG